MKATGDWIDRQDTQTVCAMLTDAGFQALLVGGCVRNALLGVEVADIDIATDARPERVMELAEAAGLRAVPTGIDHGTVTVVSGGHPHEITTFRHDLETDGRRATVAFADTVEADAARRDFTMNALYAAPDGTVIDPLGGLPDLLAHRVRFVGNADDRITEDYLRILRFFRFHAWYGDDAAGLDAEGLAACAANSAGLETLSKERIGAEMRKLLSAPDPAPSVAAMAQSGTLGRILPGADPRALPVLVHLEDGAAPRWLRRLAVIGGQNHVKNLRLSRQEARDLATLLEEAASARPADELGYLHGADLARDILLIRAALFEQPLPAKGELDIQRGVSAVFPVKAADLMPALTGAALGAKLQEIEARWIASGFALRREDLLG